jgi:S-adenosylmethionine hydrolase
MSIIALMSDFGSRDHYVAAMKGVILQINPKVTLVDISHEVNSHDLYHGAFVLRQSLFYFPPATIVVAVVDPGVGSNRKILAARYHDRVVLAPDNGLLSLVHRDAELQEMRTVENRRYFASTISTTFHGRDIFAPVAAHLSRGVPLSDLGPPAHRIEVLDMPRPQILADGSIEGSIFIVDRFGNLISNISELDLSALRSPRHDFKVFVSGRPVGPVRQAYAEVNAGEPLALIGSSQMLEVAICKGSAAQTLACGVGTPVEVR